MPEQIFRTETIEGKPDIAVIELNKHVLGGNAAIEFSGLLQEMKDNSIKCVIIDLGLVEMMNSSGLGMLIGGMTSLKKNNIEMILAAVPPKVASILEMTHLDRVFRIFPTVANAVEEC